MSEENAVAAAESAEVTDAQVDQFFESGGQEPEAQEGKQEGQQKDQQEPEKKPEEPQKEERMVNYGALHEERQRRKELQGKVEAMESRFSQLVQSLQQQQQTQLPPPEEDPVRNFDTRIGGVEQMLRQQHEALQQQQQEAAVISAYQAHAQQFAQETQDFGDAYKFIADSRVNELEALGYSRPEAIEAARRDEFFIVSRALQNGLNPAEAIYRAAQVRGYKKAEPQQQQQPDKMQTLEKGVRASKVSGGAPAAGGLPTLEELAAMSDEDFEKNWGKVIGTNGRF